MYTKNVKGLINTYKKQLTIVFVFLGIITMIVFNQYMSSQSSLHSYNKASGIPPTPLPSLCLQKEKGDANCDNFITETDRNIWREEYKQGKTTELRSDFNYDSIVNYEDYRIWFNNWKK